MKNKFLLLPKTALHNSRIFIITLLLLLITSMAKNLQAEEFEMTEVALDAESRVTEQLREFLNSSKTLQDLREKYSDAEVYEDYGVSTVLVSDEHPKWAYYRVQAYEQALENAKSKYLQFLGQTAQTNKIFTLESNLGVDPAAALQVAEASEARFLRVVNKIGAVVEGSIDKSLVELGIDPEEFYKAPKKNRVVLFKNAFMKDTLKKSYGSIRGLMPVMTVEGEGEDGTYSVGVIVVRTPGSVAFANTIIQSRGQVACTSPKPGDFIKERVKNAYLPLQHGVREVVDDYGCPAIISFGQWSYKKKPANASLNSQYKSIAYKQARINADNNIIEFTSGQVNTEETSVIDSIFEDFEEADSSGFISEDQFISLNEKYLAVVKTSAKTKIVGMKDLYRWETKHPHNGTDLLGIVRIWSPVAEKSARGVKTLGRSTQDGFEEKVANTASKKKIIKPILKAQEEF
jgi:hypothetical protein